MMSWYRKTLYLHVGTHKTGTTSIQAMLVNNYGILLNLGFQVRLERSPDHPLAGNSFELANKFLRKSLITPARHGKIVKSRGYVSDFIYLYKFWSFLFHTEVDKLIVSAEAFCFARSFSEMLTMRFLFLAARTKVIPIIFFRDPQSWRESWQSQLEKMDVVDSDSLLHDKAFLSGDWYFDKIAIVRFWSQIGEIQCVDYSLLDREGTDAVKRFLELIGVSTGIDVRQYRLNARSPL